MDKSKLIKIKCPRCGNAQTTYGRATTMVKCKGCNILLLKPKGGKAKIRAFIKHVFH
ncbi:MAG: 30S ribosomal protein S27e [Nanoarchaeota archaeon]|nr:30S ribosomal protein S27e [Nanoarchaeota archaeon]